MSKASKATKRDKKPRSKARKAGKARPGGRALVKQPPPQRPAPDDAAEREHYVETLRANRQLAEEPGPLPPGATHAVEEDEHGGKRIVRKRYSAF